MRILGVLQMAVDCLFIEDLQGREQGLKNSQKRVHMGRGRTPQLVPANPVVVLT